METEIIDFFASHGLEVTKLIAKKPPRVTAEQVKAGCISVYADRANIKVITLAREVWRRAGILDDTELKKDMLILKDTKKAIAAKQDSIDRKKKALGDKDNEIYGLKLIIEKMGKETSLWIGKHNEKDDEIRILRLYSVALIVTVAMYFLIKVA